MFSKIFSQSPQGEIFSINDSGLQSQSPESFTHFKGNQACTHYHSPFSSLLINEFSYTNGISDVSQTEDPLEVLAGYAWLPRSSTGGHHQVVESKGLTVRDFHPLLLWSDGCYPSMKSYLNSGLGKSFRGPGNELGLIPYYITDVIGGRSGREGDVLPRLHYRHLQIGIETLRFGCSTRPSSTPTDDYQFLAHGRSPIH